MTNPPDSPTSVIDTLTHDVIAAGTAVRLDGALVRETGTALTVPSPVGDSPRAVATGSREHADRAVSSAEAAMRQWAARPVQERAEVLEAIADAMDAGASGAWPELVARETGKRLAEAAGEIRFTAGYFRVAAEQLLAQGDPESLDVVPGISHQVVRQPRGVAVVLTPWNFPVSIPARKIAPALAAGCGVVFKPSEVAPLSSMVLASLLDEHLPPGLVGTVLGKPQDVVEPWLAHEAVGALSFTGSTRVGRILAGQAASRFLPSVLELGGCAPFIVLADADPEHAVEALMVAKFRNNGQSCIAANQVFVAREVSERFIALLTDRVRGLRVGDPLDPDTDIGPLAPQGDPERIEDIVADAVAHGAEVVRPEATVPTSGHYVLPAVLLGASPQSRAMREEVFGPVAPVHVYDDLEEALVLHRATGFGLAGYVCSSDVDAARALGRTLSAGIVGVNTGTPNTPYVPFGGRRESGTGYEGGREGLEFFQAAQVSAAATS